MHFRVYAQFFVVLGTNQLAHGYRIVRFLEFIGRLAKRKTYCVRAKNLINMICTASCMMSMHFASHRYKKHKCFGRVNHFSPDMGFCGIKLHFEIGLVVVVVVFFLELKPVPIAFRYYFYYYSDCAVL